VMVTLGGGKEGKGRVRDYFWCCSGMVSTEQTWDLAGERMAGMAWHGVALTRRDLEVGCNAMRCDAT
jgi:hypothetical protein